MPRLRPELEEALRRGQSRRQAQLTGEQDLTPQAPRAPEEVTGGGGFLQDLIGSLTRPAIGFGRTIGETGAAAVGAGAGLFGERELPFLGGATGEELEQAIFEGLSERESFQELAEQPLETVGRQAAGTAAFGVPMGRGAMGLMKGGAAAGGLFAAAEEEADIGDIAKGMAFGGIAAPLAGAAFPAISKVVGKGASSVAPTVAPVLSRAAQVFKLGYKVPANTLKPFEVNNVAQKMTDYGFMGGPSRMRGIVSKVTGSEGTLSKLTRDVIAEGAEGREIPIGSVWKALHNLKANATAVERNRLTKEVQQITKIVSKAPGKQIDTKNPLDLFDAIKELKKLSMEQARLGWSRTGEKEANQQLYHLYNGVTEELFNALETNVASRGALANLAPKAIESLKKLSPALADDVSKAKSVADLRSLQKPFVDLGKMVTFTEEKQMSASSLERLARFGLGGALGVGVHPALGAAYVLPEVSQIVLGPGAGSTIAAQVLRRGGQIGSKLTGPVTKAVQKTLDDIPEPALNNLPKFAAIVAASAGQRGQPHKTLSGEELEIEELTKEPSQPEQPTYVAQDEYKRVAEEIAVAMIKFPDQAKAIESAFNIWSEANYPQGGEEISSFQQQQLLSMSNVELILGNLEEQLEGISPRGRGFGQVLQAAGKFTPFAENVRVYEDMRKGIIATFAKTVSGEMGRLTDQDIQRAEGLIPRLTDTPSEAANKLRRVRQMVKDKTKQIITLPKTMSGLGGFEAPGMSITNEEDLFGPAYGDYGY